MEGGGSGPGGGIMRWRDLMGISLKNTARRGKKTFLSSIAVSVGIASLVLVSAAGRGAYEMAGTELARLGIDGWVLHLENTDDHTLDPVSAQLLEEHVPGIDSTMPLKWKTGTVQLLFHTEGAVIWGVGEKMTETLHVDLLYGRDLRASDLISHARCAVIDEELAQRVYKRSNIVGKLIELRVGEQWDHYEIVGIIASQTSAVSSLLGPEIGCFVYVPYTVVNENTGEYSIEQIAVRCREGTDEISVMQRAAAYLSHAAPVSEGNYTAENITAYLEQVKKIVKLIGSLIAAIGSISLLVAGMGVMNSMLASLEERKRELGIFLAVGADSQDVLWNLLLESLFVCVTGGIMGCLFGGFGVIILSKWIPCKAELWDILTALGVSGICGIFFGTIPAVKASRMNPAEIWQQTS